MMTMAMIIIKMIKITVVASRMCGYNSDTQSYKILLSKHPKVFVSNFFLVSISSI